MTSSPPSSIPRCKRPRTPLEEDEGREIQIEFLAVNEPSTKIPRWVQALSGVSARVHGILPAAPKLKDFLAPGGYLKFRPRLEWYISNSAINEKPLVPSPLRTLPLTYAAAPADGLLPDDAYPEYNIAPPQAKLKPMVFGKDRDHALHVAIRENATEAAIVLLNYGAPLEVENAKCFTPLILAAQKGNVELVKELLERGASPAATTCTGISAVLQAAHFGHDEVLKVLLQAGSSFLIEIANYNHTTPLMRAAQEGHVKCVQLLLESGAHVNRRNRAHLTALMLASQRGHADVCQVLIQYGADLDAMTHQNSTSLLLAVKRGHIDVLQVLVTAGCELSVKESRGRTAREVAARRGQSELVELLDPSVQVDLMRRQGRRKRSWEMIRSWHLLQQERANILVEDVPPTNVHQIHSLLEAPQTLPYIFTVRSTTALLRTMTLPEPLVEMISQYLPLPHLWEKQIGMLAKRASVNADDAVSGALDLIDEILEEGGFLQACDLAHITPPMKFNTWAEWKVWCTQKGSVQGSSWRGYQPVDLTTATCPAPRNMDYPNVPEVRRHAGFLRILSYRPPALQHLLANPPFKLPITLQEKLINCADVASITRRIGSRGVHFDISIAMDLVMVVSQLCSWYWRERDEVKL